MLDELSSALPAIQSAAYRLILDREVGQHKLHERVMLCAAGNSITDGAIAYHQSTALASRMAHFEVEMHLDSWIDWAMGAGIDHRVIGFAEFRPELLTQFNPTKVKHSFPCGRTYEFLSKVVSGHPVTFSDYPLYASVIGEGAASEFESYCSVYHKLPTIQEIIDNPTSYKLPDEPSTQLALGTMIATAMDKNNAEALVEALERIDIALQVSAFQKVFVKDKTLSSVPAIAKWITTNAHKF